MQFCSQKIARYAIPAVALLLPLCREILWLINSRRRRARTYKHVYFSDIFSKIEARYFIMFFFRSSTRYRAHPSHVCLRSLSSRTKYLMTRDFMLPRTSAYAFSRPTERWKSRTKTSTRFSSRVISRDIAARANPQINLCVCKVTRESALH